jgi:NAD(P)-dependent dehydrogenase (short-subunit alcohol dehydrogenase family)
MEFSGKVALITGGGGGIGRATALGFSRCGAKVVVVDLDRAEGEASAELVRQRGGEVRFVHADVTKSGDVQSYVKSALDAYGAIDCFFNNAGIEGKVMPTQEYDEVVFDAVIGVNLKGCSSVCGMCCGDAETGHGAVVNTASVAGLFGGPGMAPYVASKHAVLGLTKVASADVARLGVRVNPSVPGQSRRG